LAPVNSTKQTQKKPRGQTEFGLVVF